MAIDFKFKDFFHPLEILRLRKVFERTQWLPREELLDYQARRLSVVLEQAFKNVPYYRRLFREVGFEPADIRGTADLDKLPLLTKEAVRTNFEDLTAGDASRHSPRLYTTSGSSGEPLRFYLDKHANALEFTYYLRHWSWAGYSLGTPFAELGSQFFLNRSGFEKKVFSYQPHLRRLMLNSSMLSVTHAGEFVDSIRRYKPRYLKGLASALYFLAVILREAGFDDLSFSAVFSTGEVLIPLYRSEVESFFHCKVLDSYGHMERTAAISQCPHGGYHINSDYGLLELIASEDSRSTEPRYRAVGTSLYNMAMPLIRYDIGDEFELFKEPQECPCGRTLPLVKKIHGRKEDAIITPDGRFITSLFTVPEYVTGVEFVQFIQDTERSVEVNVVPGVEWSGRNESELRHFTGKMLGPEMNLKIRTISRNEIKTDASGKRRVVISLIKGSHR